MRRERAAPEAVSPCRRLSKERRAGLKRFARSLVAVVAGWVFGCASIPSPAPAPAPALAPSSGLESTPSHASVSTQERVEALIRDWFVLLEAHAHGAPTNARLLAGPPLELAPAERGSLRSDALQAWLDELRSPHLQVDFRVTRMRVDATEDGLHRARFEVERRALDGDGILHVASWRQVWRIGRVDGPIPRVFQIDEQSLLVFPGTGTRIICN